MVAKFVQPDSTTQTGTTYKGSIDAAVAVLAEQAAQFAVTAQDTPNMTVAMRAGRILRADGTVLAVAAQNSAALTAPATNPRNDIVYIDAVTGAIGVAAGAEAATPADPIVPANKIPIARVQMSVGIASVTNSVIDDLRLTYRDPVRLVINMALANWRTRSLPATVYSLFAICYGAPGFIAVGSAGSTDAYIVWSRSGLDGWLEQANPKNFSLFGVVYAASQYVAVGNADGADAYIITSPDGATWTERANPKNFALTAIAHGNGVYVAVGNADGTDAYIVTSTDGITWTERANPKNFALFGVVYANGLFVAVGNADGADAYIITSPDGATWTERANPKNFALQAIAYGNGLFVAVGNADGTDAYIVTSTDGVTWTERANPKNLFLRGIAFGAGVFVAVGQDETAEDAYIITSFDGAEWAERWSETTALSEGNDLEAAVYGRGMFVAVGTVGGALTSLNIGL